VWLERLCRYLLRPPLAQERLRRRADGRILSRLRKAWNDGTTHLLDPLELLEKLAALTPRPEAHLILYHGVLAPHAAWRRRVVGFGRPAGDVGAAVRGVDPRASRPRLGAPVARTFARDDSTTRSRAGRGRSRECRKCREVPARCVTTLTAVVASAAAPAPRKGVNVAYTLLIDGKRPEV